MSPVSGSRSRRARHPDLTSSHPVQRRLHIPPPPPCRACLPRRPFLVVPDHPVRRPHERPEPALRPRRPEQHGPAAGPGVLSSIPPLSARRGPGVRRSSGPGAGGHRDDPRGAPARSASCTGPGSVACSRWPSRPRPRSCRPARCRSPNPSLSPALRIDNGDTVAPAGPPPSPGAWRSTPRSSWPPARDGPVPVEIQVAREDCRPGEGVRDTIIRSRPRVNT